MPWLAAELPPDIPATCITRASEHFSLPEVALVSVLRQEGGKVGVAYPRSHGTYYGPFQISDKWLPTLAKWGITEKTLRDDACTNVIAGAYVLAYYKVREARWEDALARYNVGSLNTEARREAGYRYASKVLGHWADIYSKWIKKKP